MKYLFLLLPFMVQSQNCDSLQQIINALESRLTKEHTVSIYLDRQVDAPLGWVVYVDGKETPFLPTTTKHNLRFLIGRGERKIELCRIVSKSEDSESAICNEKYFYIQDPVTILTSHNFSTQ